MGFFSLLTSSLSFSRPQGKIQLFPLIKWTTSLCNLDSTSNCFVKEKISFVNSQTSERQEEGDKLQNSSSRSE